MGMWEREECGVWTDVEQYVSKITPEGGMERNVSRRKPEGRLM
jgi:hypothetical protein